MFKIVNIIRSLQIGGAEILVKNIINSNNNEQFVHYILYIDAGPLLYQVNPEKRKQLIQCKYRNPILFIIFLRRILRNLNIDIIHTHQPVDVLFAACAIIGLKIKIVRTYHGFSGLISEGLLSCFKSKVLNFVINRVNCLNLYVSETIFCYFKSGNAVDKSDMNRVLYNGIDMKGVKRCKSTGVRQDLGILESGIILGMIGSFNEPARDQFTVCLALKMLIKVTPDIHFLFIGRTSGKSHDPYEKCYNFCTDNDLLNNIHFLGERSDISELLNNLDLYVHSSNYETFGLSLIEAMAYELPCIASDIGIFREVSDNGINIILFEKGNAKDLSEKILLEIQYLESNYTKQRIWKAKAFVKERFSIERHISTLHTYYLECLK